ncbi:AraC family transcriptional regulator [Amnibacterium kyonggiense]|uniref:Helix-turn-helix protein n=1 Tax=Amnibacterium kyonggiense TaxID=595671 RepID=A0A4R7FSC2_9MICO|nr:helix-turn-helix domain-containing protein [Amnibacterium kyonggiense]TDS80757.1 helix-turn-helix protein [Amnibacterium kyonggiense]
MGTGAVERRSVRTTDLDEAIQTLCETFGESDLRRADHEEPSFALRCARTGELITARWSITGADGGSRGTADAEPLILTGVVLGGRMRMRGRWEEVDTTRPFLYPEPVHADLEQLDMANLGITRSAVEQRASAITGVDGFELRFTGTAPFDPAMDQAWRDTTAYAARMTEALADGPGAALARVELVDLVIALLLRTFPNTTLDAVHRRDVTGPRGAALRRALQYVDDHAAEPVTVVEIAEAARLSPRGLYAAFQRDLGTTPMAHLREVRLHAVRDELRAMAPEDAGADVDAVALRWGFAHTRRFRERYASRFGEAPGDTLVR